MALASLQQQSLRMACVECIVSAVHPSSSPPLSSSCSPSCIGHLALDSFGPYKGERGGGIVYKGGRGGGIVGVEANRNRSGPRAGRSEVPPRAILNEDAWRMGSVVRGEGCQGDGEGVMCDG